jgi:hypothetical protein
VTKLPALDTSVEYMSTVTYAIQPETRTGTASIPRLRGVLNGNVITPAESRARVREAYPEPS